MSKADSMFSEEIRYDYSSKIKTPYDLQMRPEGSFEAIGNNISGLIAYMKVLLEGNGSGLKNLGNSQTLGNKFFYKTNTKCIDSATKEKVDRYTYINNTSDTINMMGVDLRMDGMKGLIPSTMNNVSKLNPVNLYTSITEKSTPKCKPITLDVIDTDGNCRSEKHHISLSEIKNMPDSWKVPYCAEAFSDCNVRNGKYSNDIGTKMYMLGINVLFLYILIKLFYKR